MHGQPTTRPSFLIAVVVHPDIDLRVPILVVLSEQNGWLVHGGSNGAEAVQLALAALPQLILLDPYLQGMDGVATITTLRAHGITCPVVALVQDNDESRDSWEARGFAGALPLSDGLTQLVPQLHALLGHTEP